MKLKITIFDGKITYLRPNGKESSRTLDLCKDILLLDFDSDLEVNEYTSRGGMNEYEYTSRGGMNEYEYTIKFEQKFKKIKLGTDKLKTVGNLPTDLDEFTTYAKRLKERIAIIVDEFKRKVYEIEI